MQTNWIRVLLKQRIAIIAVILSQIGFMLALIAGSLLFFRYVNWILRGISVLVCIDIINKKRKPAYKLSWIFLILLFPIFGGFLYLVFHFQSDSRVFRRKIESARGRCRPFYVTDPEALAELVAARKEYRTLARYLHEKVGYPVYAHTRTEYFNSGEGFFIRVLEELEKAERYIFLEFFILRMGVMLDPIIEILERKARSGVDVRLMYDDLGCFMSLPPHFPQYLRERGIRSQVFNPFTPLLSSLQNNRDHRKIIVIDGKTAFTGGVNLADEYINALERFGHWKDAAIMVYGEAAWSFTLIFLQMWNVELKQKDDFKSFYPWTRDPCPVSSAGYVQPYADNPIDPENVGEHVYMQIINNAKEYVYINTPYLVVDDNLISALTLAAKSGVDVRIITPHRWDKKIVAVTSRSFYRQLVSSGVKVYEYTNGFNHSKTFVSDDRVATVGTINLDFRSLYLHFECGVCVYEDQTVQAVKADFLATLPLCHQITLEDCARNAFQVMLQDILRLFAPLM
ncbi:MAG: cardiolipin synthase [Spirochaetaceae bacterium]|nr:cardiolipin synthase [Spirochaetaceae bacterium]